MKDFYHSERIHRAALAARVGHFLLDAVAVLFMLGCALVLAYALAAPNQ